MRNLYGIFTHQKTTFSQHTKLLYIHCFENCKTMVMKTTCDLQTNCHNVMKFWHVSFKGSCCPEIRMGLSTALPYMWQTGYLLSCTLLKYLLLRLWVSKTTTDDSLGSFLFYFIFFFQNNRLTIIEMSCDNLILKSKS